MHDFGKLVYLDLQKTGSTFVSSFLNSTCKLQVVKESKHGRIRDRGDPSIFYFITVRHPISQYSSLFRYGLDGRGALYERMAHRGIEFLYRKDAKSYNQWLRFMLDFDNANVLGEGFERIPRDYDLGFLSYRYLMLSLPRAEKVILKKPKTVELTEYAREKSIVNHIILNERLNEQLRELATKIKPEFFDQESVDRFFRGVKKVNASTVSAEDINEIESDVYELILRRERVLLRLYS
jgi:hypothetical protein